MHYPVPFETNGVQTILLLDVNKQRSCLVISVRRFAQCLGVLYSLARLDYTGQFSVGQNL